MQLLQFKTPLYKNQDTISDAILFVEFRFSLNLSISVCFRLIEKLSEAKECIFCLFLKLKENFSAR